MDDESVAPTLVEITGRRVMGHLRGIDDSLLVVSGIARAQSGGAFTPWVGRRLDVSLDGLEYLFELPAEVRRAFLEYLKS